MAEQQTRRPRLLVLGLNYAPEPIGIGPYTAGLCEGLAARGWDVEVVAGRPYYPAWRAMECPDDGAERGVRVSRRPHYIPARPTAARRLVHYLSFAASALPALLRAARRKPDIVLSVCPALLAAPAAWIAARLSGAKLWLHVQDFEVEAAFATGLVGQGGPLARLALWFERAMLRRADLASTIGPAMLRKLADKRGSAQDTFELRNWANHPAGGGPLRDFRQEWSLGDRKVALYSGNIAAKQGLDIVIEAAHQLSDRADLVFVICGEGPNREALEARASGLANVQFRDLQPAEDVAALMQLASVHLLPQLAGAADLVLPSKLTNMLASGRPVIATAAADTGLAAEIEGCGVAVPPGDAGALADAIAALAGDPARAARLGEAATARAASVWDRDAILDRADAELRRRVAGP